MTEAGAPVPGQAPDGVRWPQGRWLGRERFRELLIEGLECAAAAGSRTVWLCDPDFSAWPLGERRLIQALDAWCLATRSSPVAQLRVLGQSFADMRLRHGGFVAWRSLWVHRVQVRAWPQEADGLPSVLWTPQWVLQRVDLERDTMLASVDAAQRTLLGERLQQCWQMARPAFPDTALGL